MVRWEYPDIADRLHGEGPYSAMEPPIICLCGSTRYRDEFQHQNAVLSLKGYIILTVGFFHHFGEHTLSDESKQTLDMLHKRKIDLCDEVFVLNVDRYIGESTRSEIDYALAIGRPVRYLENGDG